MSGFKPVKKLRLYEDIVDQIQTLIQQGDLEPGQRLPPERSLAEELGVSRTSVREALRSLEMMGYIESRVGVGGGTFIKQMSFENTISPFLHTLGKNSRVIAELFEAHSFLQTELARLAATQSTEHDIAELEAAAEQISTELSHGKRDPGIEARFRRSLGDAAHNRILQEFGRICEELLENELDDYYRTHEDAWKNTLHSYFALIGAVKNRDAHTAQRIMHDHQSEIIKQAVPS